VSGDLKEKDAVKGVGVAGATPARHPDPIRAGIVSETEANPAENQKV
jgi:hypothetical protein